MRQPGRGECDVKKIADVWIGEQWSLWKRKREEKKFECADFENNKITPSRKCIQFREQDLVATAEHGQSVQYIWIKI